MYEQKAKCRDEESRYARKVLAKYTSPKCPTCNILTDSIDHLTVCPQTASTRKEIQESICNTLKKLVEACDQKERETNETKIVTAIRRWLSEYKEGWKIKWGWFGYMSTELTDTLKKIKWVANQSQISIQKKIQVLVAEGMHECWVRRCQALHKKPTNKEKTDKMREQAQERCEKIVVHSKRVEKKKAFNAKTAFSSDTRYTNTRQLPPEESVAPAQAQTPTTTVSTNTQIPQVPTPTIEKRK